MIALYGFDNNVSYLDISEVKHILKEIKNNFKGSSVTTNIFEIKAYDSVICQYFWIGFINCMLKGESLTDFNNPF